MFQSYFRHLFLLVFVVVFLACQKNEDVVLYTELDAESYIELQIDQKILFHYAKLDATGQTTAGWVIDKNGEVRTYDFGEQGWPNKANECTTDDMAELEHSQGELLTTVSADEIVEHFKKIGAAFHWSPDLPEGRIGQSATAFYAYRYNEPQTNNSYNGSCSEGEHNSDYDFHSNIYDQVVLMHSGASGEVHNSGDAGQAILNWLEGIQEEVKF